MSNQVLVASPPAPPAAPRLLDQVRIRAQAHFGRPEPGERFAQWVRRLVVLHGMRHPRELFHEDVGRFPEHVAQTEKDPLRALESCHEALTFLYGQVLQLQREPFVIPQPPRLLDRIRHALRVGRGTSPKGIRARSRLVGIGPGVGDRKSVV